VNRHAQTKFPVNIVLRTQDQIVQVLWSPGGKRSQCRCANSSSENATVDLKGAAL